MGEEVFDFCLLAHTLTENVHLSYSGNVALLVLEPASSGFQPNSLGSPWDSSINQRQLTLLVLWTTTGSLPFLQETATAGPLGPQPVSHSNLSPPPFLFTMSSCFGQDSGYNYLVFLLQLLE